MASKVDIGLNLVCSYKNLIVPGLIRIHYADESKFGYEKYR